MSVYKLDIKYLGESVYYNRYISESNKDEFVVWFLARIMDEYNIKIEGCKVYLMNHLHLWILQAVSWNYGYNQAIKFLIKR